MVATKEPQVKPSFSGPWPAPAKLNLMLRVVGRRRDGYHELQTVFQLIDRCDHLHFRVRDDGRVRRLGGPEAVASEQDLTVRAAALLQRHSGCGLGVDIRIDKRLPMGGGLGGGSSDAATTLAALNRLWRLGLGEDALAALGLSLGADVPVFVRGHAAWGEGVGKRLTPLELARHWYLVLIPDCHVATAEVFAAEELKRDSSPIAITDFLAGNAVNDCLPVVRRRYAPGAEAIDWLDRYAAARLTGTGACVFAAFKGEAEALRVLERAPAHLRAFVARGQNHSPLLECGV
jgi:4-diphosphocytidyl-2-C-methyl-D-erythritol kinase